MITIRRIYVYLLAFFGLLMLAGGAANLGRVVLEVLLAAPRTAGPTTCAKRFRAPARQR